MQYQIALFITVVQGILLLGHFFVYRTVVGFFDITDPKLLGILRPTFILLSLLFTTATLMASQWNNLFTRTFYTAAAAWLGFAYFFLWGSIFLWLRYGVSRMTGLWFNGPLCATIVFSVAGLLAVASLVNAQVIRVTRVTMTLPNLPVAWKGRTAVWASDLHIGQVHGGAFAERIAKLVKAQHPDIVFIGGDFYDGTPVDTKATIAPFAKLDAPLGTFFITGNHEEFVGDTRFIDPVREAGIVVLNDELIEREGLQIVGIDYRTSADKETLARTLETVRIDPSHPAILLKHAPNNLDVVERFPIALQLSGHTHDGQLWPLNFVSARVYHGFDNGLKKLNGLSVYTSSGTGTWGPPLRFFTRPEIVVFTFQ